MQAKEQSELSPESRKIRQLARCINYIQDPKSRSRTPKIPDPLIEEARGLLERSASAGRKRGLLLKKMHVERAAILADLKVLEAMGSRV